MAGSILAGDLGGTQVRLGLFRARKEGLPLEESRTYLSSDLGGLEEAVDRFLGELGIEAVDAACFGVAGPVAGNRGRMTHLEWWVDGEVLAKRLGTSRVRVVNDLVATAHGIGALAPEDLAPLNPAAVASAGTAVLVGAGTGLGLALLTRCDGEAVALASEGGHMAFAPRDELEWALRQYLAGLLGGRVSVERVVSGPGIHHIYRFLVEERGATVSPAVARRMERGDPSRVVAEAGQEGACATCARALDLFASAYGAVAGDAALMAGASGGVFLTGGVAAKLVGKLSDGTFLRAFVDKGRLSSFVERVPVNVVLREETAFLGAARQAARLI